MSDTETELATMFEQTQTNPVCPYCRGLHPQTTCPRVAAIEFHENGIVKRVEFREPAPDVLPFERQPSSSTFTAEHIGIYRPPSE